MNEVERPLDREGEPPRYLACRFAVVRAAGGAAGATEPSPYRRCPVGVIASPDCPEYVGRTCAFQQDRGAGPAVGVSPEEVDALAAELARDYLTVAYARRLARLRTGRPEGTRGAALLATHPPAAAAATPPPVRRERLVATGPVNVAADRDRGGRPS